MAVVMNRQEVDSEVMRRLKKVAYDTCKGITFSVVKALSKYPRGLEPRTIGAIIHKPTQTVNGTCRFLSEIGVVSRSKSNRRANYWKLDEYVLKLARLVLE